MGHTLGFTMPKVRLAFFPRHYLSNRCSIQGYSPWIIQFLGFTRTQRKWGSFTATYRLWDTIVWYTGERYPRTKWSEVPWASHTGLIFFQSLSTKAKKCYQSSLRASNCPGGFGNCSELFPLKSKQWCVLLDFPHPLNPNSLQINSFRRDKDSDYLHSRGFLSTSVKWFGVLACFNNVNFLLFCTLYSRNQRFHTGLDSEKNVKDQVELSRATGNITDKTFKSSEIQPPPPTFKPRGPLSTNDHLLSEMLLGLLYSSWVKASSFARPS